MILSYGNTPSLTGYRNKTLDLSSCTKDKKKTSCNVQVDLKDYDGEQIEYWFVLKDIANTVVESKHVWLGVDITAPKINNPTSLFRIDGKYVYFKLNITEKNLDSITYIDNADRIPRAKKLCSANSVKNGMCEKKVSFKEGNHNVDIQAIDKAGNMVAQNIVFDMVY